MANVIRVTPEELKAAASRMETCSDALKKETDEMVEIVDTLTGRIWSGEAQKEYVSRFDSLSMDIEMLHMLISEHVEHLNTIANEYQTAENTNKEVVESLSANIIS